MGIVDVGSPQSPGLQVVGESRPAVDAGQLTFSPWMPPAGPAPRR